MKLLSLIIPIYNAEKTLEECVASAVGQTYSPKEIILVDDGSTDSCPGRCDAYCAAYEFVRCVHKPNGGLSSARNAGLDAAKGEYIAFLDADDCFDLNACEELIRALEETGSDLSAGGVCQEYSGKIDISPKKRPIPEPIFYPSRDDTIRSLFSKHSIQAYVWNKVYTIEAIGSVRFHEDAVLEDLLFTWEILTGNVTKACMVDVPFYHYRYMPTSLTKKNGVERTLRSVGEWGFVIESMEQKLPHLTKDCIESLAWNYLIWSLVVLKRMLETGAPDRKTLEEMRQHFRKYGKYIRYQPVQNRILIHLALRSWTLYALAERSLIYMKKHYVRSRRGSGADRKML